jgi:hypothetical protein
MARSLVLGGDSMLYKDDEDLDSPSEVHLHGDMTILFCIFYYMHVGNKNEFILFLVLVSYHLHFVQM